MNKKLIIRYILICLPFVIGGLLYCFGIINIFSSLLLFCGGYLTLKNTVDYRKVKKNKDIVNRDKNSYKKDYTNRSVENIVGFKRTRRYSKVRKRIKY